MLSTLMATAQPAINGPMPGHVDFLEAKIWLQCHGQCTASLTVWPVHAPDSAWHTRSITSDAYSAHAMEFIVNGLRPGLDYQYQVHVNGVTIPFPEPLSFRTQSIWKHRGDAPDFTMAMGSCTYVNEPDHDRPGRAFGDTYGVFDAIADKEPDLMLWMGDNVYLREPDWGSRSGYLHRYTHTRSVREMQRLLRATKHYAIWDDHDFGPNDANGSWVHAPMSRDIFDLFWANPTCGVPGAEQSTATMFSHADVDFFLLDNRTNRVPAGMVTMEPAMLGKGQLNWLIQALKYSKASFKMVAMGGQVLNSAAVFENYATIAGERDELLRRIEEEGIRNVIFLSGDRHFGELSQVPLKDGRVLYDLTVSPLTAGPFSPNETNAHHVEGTRVVERNFATLSFTGTLDARVMRIEVFAADGRQLWERSIARQ